MTSSIYFLIELPRSSTNSPTLRRPRPIASCVSPAASSATPSSCRFWLSVRSPAACFTLPLSASALPSNSSRFIWFLLNDCPAPADDAYQEQHNRDHQKHMDNRSDGVDTDQTEQPRDEQNQRECQQHSVLLFTGASGCRLLRSNESASAAPRAANG